MAGAVSNTCYCQAFVPESQLLPAEAAYVVIGGGLAGVGTAYWLNQRGLPCVLLEGRALGSGASGRNGGVISPTHATPLARAFHEENIAHLRQVMAEQEVDCEYRVGGYLSLAYEETEDAERVGIHAEDDTTEYWGPDKVKAALGGAETFDGRKLAGGMFKRDAGHVWPAKLVQTLAKACTQTTFCTHTVALSISPAIGRNRGRPRVEIQTDKGPIIADKVCVCTNGWAPRLLPTLGISGAIYPVRNNVLMTAPTRAWDWPGSVSVPSTDTNEYMYCMKRPDGRLVIGGRHDSARSDDDSVGNDNAATRMKEFLTELLANFDEQLVVEKEWVGVKGYTVDGRPIVGPLPQSLLHNGLEAGTVFVGAGFNGHGMPACSGAGKALAAMMAGDEHVEDVHEFVRATMAPARFVDAQASANL